MSTWNSKLYDTNHSFVSKYGESLITVLAPQKTEVICDLGCGTGDLTYKISESGAKVIGIDNSASMIKEACKKYPSLEFYTQDIRKLQYTQKFDAIISNAVLHWIKEPHKAFSSIWKALKFGGRFITEFGGRGNIKLIVNAIYKTLDSFGFSENKKNNPWNFLDLEECRTLLEDTGFTVHKILSYERLTELEKKEQGLVNWLSMFASDFFKKIPKKLYKKMLKDIRDELRPHLFKNGKWHIDYLRLRLTAKKTKP